jgi:DMSO/TMAO reductase YedYZ molybdopterin-dependent catalytic subunit
MNTTDFRAIRWVACAICTITLTASSVIAQTNDATLVVCGAVEKPLTLSLTELQAMPRSKLIVREKDGAATYEGVMLFEIVSRAKPRLTEKCCSNTVNTVVVIQAADNYQTVFSLPELDPKFGPGKILLADRREGQALDPAHGPLQIIVPDEKVHARWVRQVKTIEVLPIGDLPGATNSPPR